MRHSVKSCETKFTMSLVKFVFWEDTEAWTIQHLGPATSAAIEAIV
jgi:hypothetical protein